MTLRELRKRKGYFSAEVFAVDIHTSASTIKRAELGERIRNTTAWRIARALGTTPEAIEGLNYEGRPIDVQQGDS